MRLQPVDSVLGGTRWSAQLQRVEHGIQADGSLPYDRCFAVQRMGSTPLTQIFSFSDVHDYKPERAVIKCTPDDPRLAVTNCEDLIEQCRRIEYLVCFPNPSDTGVGETGQLVWQPQEV